jgi:xanthosine utilization system XapX-like protein
MRGRGVEGFLVALSLLLLSLLAGLVFSVALVTTYLLAGDYRSAALVGIFTIFLGAVLFAVIRTVLQDESRP